ncbi:MAG TPA: valine--tRNA ligase [Steroidobacteraceae bacterium]|nr:valine--tRNA ligase [Steroidobacteraceae bacterium]
MDKVYSPREIEARLYGRWEASGCFAPSGHGPPYSIVIPPPNVTGTLHMGHAFQHTLMDALTRLHRMDGDNTLWQPGTDHAGIATQMVVERQLAAESKSRHDLGREAFVARVWQWKEESGGTISRQMRRLGASVDWSRDRFTMDAGLSAAVTEVFVRLHDEGLIYRGKRLVNWDPVLHTALSDLEVIAEPESGHLWHVRYPLADGSGHIVVATTRPETILGDTGVAVHPDDERYRSLVGKQVRLPLTNRLVPIIVDTYVDSSFGSGALKITPGHDFNDYELGRRHNLPVLNIFDRDARIVADAAADLAAVSAELRGLERFAARKRVVALLEAQGLIEKIEPHSSPVPRGDRSEAVLEPWLTDQWYVRITPLAQPAIRCVEDGRTRFVPESWAKTYFQWMRNIQDWCISRQLWWGHRIPAWYDEAGNIFVAASADAARELARKKHGREVPLRQDEDVLDTWFSSALWPFSTLGWPEQTPELKTFYPTSVLVTGFDIIFFWVARMIMMGLKFAGEVPFHEVYITGLIRDEHGDKMSKSKGNILDPIDLIDGIALEPLLAKRTSGLMQPHLRNSIEKNTRKQFPNGIPAFGTDAVRFTFAALASPGRDIRFDLGRVEGYRNFCNKIWNAARYVLMMTEGKDCGLTGTCELSSADAWIRGRLQHAITTVRESLAGYRFDLAAAALYEFTWYEFCDWYLEFTKPVLQAADASEAEQRGTRRMLLEVLEALLRLLHPLMPFITEEIWLQVAPLAGRTGATIMKQPFPRAADYSCDESGVRAIELIKELILKLRNIRGENDIPSSKRLERVFVKHASAAQLATLAAHRRYFDRLANAELVPFDASCDVDTAASALVGTLEIYVPLRGLKDDLAAEAARIAKLQERARKELAAADAKLANPEFMSNAPPAVTAKARERADELRRELAQLAAQLERLEKLR